MSIDVLQEKIRVLKNPTMVGLDPTPEVVPGYLLEEARRELGVTPAAAAAAYSRFCRELLEGLRDVVPAVKVQSACFDALGSSGVEAMQEVLGFARELGYYVLLDSMRGDVPGTAELCARAAFGTVEEVRASVTHMIDGVGAGGGPPVRAGGAKTAVQVGVVSQREAA